MGTERGPVVKAGIGSDLAAADMAEFEIARVAMSVEGIVVR